MPFGHLEELRSILEGMDRMQAGKVVTDQAHQQLLALA